jgi:hypothetical protein
MINLAPISILLILIALLAWRYSRRKRAEDYASLPFRNLNKSNKPGHVNEITFKERVFFHEYTFSQKTDAVEDLVIYTEVNTHAHLKILAGKKLKSAALEFGRHLQYETGDMEFDETFYVNCDNPKIKNDVFGNANIRQALLKAMLSSSSKITLIDGLLKFSIPVVHFREIKELENGERIYTALSKIAEQLPKELSFMRPVTAGPIYTPRDWARISPLILAIIATLMWQVSSSLYEPIDFNSMLLAAISIALPLAITYVLLSLKALKGTFSTRRQYSYIIITAVTALPLLSLGLLIFTNGHFDLSKSTPKEWRVESKNMTGRAYDKFRIILRSKEDPLLTKSLYLSREQYLEIEERKSMIVIFEKEGALGYPWIKSFQLKPKSTE